MITRRGRQTVLKIRRGRDVERLSFRTGKWLIEKLDVDATDSFAWGALGWNKRERSEHRREAHRERRSSC